ncbi:phosphonate ABC transporter, permease protein PhnE [Actinopolymorpha alba]|uniref:phosphonate ABC transporter, permease protein PhnE n=1 Tax=Actinopolymorpha alba TaxID=533267 RepID=UPI000373C9A3|nr:phosphonate ABC transporter, permease protein PhnE [Actinopolymorpha alba]
MTTTGITTGGAGRLPVPPRPRRIAAVGSAVVLIVLMVVAHAVAWRETEFSVGALADGWRGMVEFLGEAIPPDLSDTTLERGLGACVVTLAIGLLGTTFSIPFSLVLALLGSRTTSRSPVVYQAARFVMSFFRAVPDIVFALIFVTAVGLGPFAGVLALICHNTGVMGKLWSEAMEEIDEGPVEALRTAGASSVQIASHVVLPSAAPQFVGLLLYRFDVNVRSSLVLGLVGAGGIGFLINKSIQLFRFDEMMTYIVMILALIVAVDVLSGKIRHRLSDA